MERVLIVSKTRMKNGACVSGLTRDTNKSVRLIPPGRFNQPNDTIYDIGQVWDVEFQENQEVTLPHVEDVTVIRHIYVAQVANMRETLVKRVRIWQGEPNALFDNLLVLRNTSAYISRDRGMPVQSTGYWMPDEELFLTSEDGKHRYNMQYAEFSIPYVGFASPISVIKKGTLLRVSLARWWRPYGLVKIDAICSFQAGICKKRPYAPLPCHTHELSLYAILAWFTDLKFW